LYIFGLTNFSLPFIHAGNILLVHLTKPIKGNGSQNFGYGKILVWQFFNNHYLEDMNGRKKMGLLIQRG